MTTRNHSTGKREPDSYTKMRRARAALRKVQDEKRKRAREEGKK